MAKLVTFHPNLFLNSLWVVSPVPPIPERVHQDQLVLGVEEVQEVLPVVVVKRAKQELTVKMVKTERTVKTGKPVRRASRDGTVLMVILARKDKMGSWSKRSAILRIYLLVSRV